MGLTVGIGRFLDLGNASLHRLAGFRSCASGHVLQGWCRQRCAVQSRASRMPRVAMPRNPSTLRKHGWVGIWLDGRKVDWPVVEDLVEQSYRCIAPSRLVARLPQD